MIASKVILSYKPCIWILSLSMDLNFSETHLISAHRLIFELIYMYLCLSDVLTLIAIQFDEYNLVRANPALVK